MVSAVVFLAIGGYFLYASTSHSSYDSTVNLEPGLAYELHKTLPAGSTITGSFREVSGQPVNLYIMDSSQFASFQNGGYTASLYQVAEEATSTFAYTTQTGDIYYLLFRHGSGLADTTETITVARDYAVPDTFRQGLGLLNIALAGMFAALAVHSFRARRR